MSNTAGGEKQGAGKKPKEEKDEQKTKTRPDYNHRIVTRPESDEYERRMNHEIRAMKKLDPAKDADRILALREDVTLLAFKVFKIVGPGVTGGVDHTFLEVLEGGIVNYDPSKNVNFSWYIRASYALHRNDELSASDQFNEDAASLDAMLDESIDGGPTGHEFRGDWGHRHVSGDQATAMHALDDVYDRGEILYDSYSPVDDLGPEAINVVVDAVEEAVFVQVLALVNGFLNHAEDKKAHTPKGKLYKSLLFTERLTSTIKQLSGSRGRAPFEQHEREAFEAAELSFQDLYTVDMCRSMRELHGTDIKESVGSVEIAELFRPEGSEGGAELAGRAETWHIKEIQAARDNVAVWTLPNMMIATYVKEKLGLEKRDGNPTVSEQRRQYQELRKKIEIPHPTIG